MQCGEGNACVLSIAVCRLFMPSEASSYQVSYLKNAAALCMIVELLPL